MRRQRIRPEGSLGRPSASCTRTPFKRPSLLRVSWASPAAKSAAPFAHNLRGSYSEKPQRSCYAGKPGTDVPGSCLVKRHYFVAFGVWPVTVCPFNHGHTSSGVQVQGHEVEQVLGGVAHEL